ncbi:type II toxin-antitoxin system VapC family toxin [Corynebacterium sp. CCUG 65737]|uniref:type II toxin-antitoxin system VapC family toxin n=1 Tax=Corynebacterium sp. CCUG 65737 TaxID=2823889 RepID=UPI002109FE2D|nr:type II toxin-antitoxin system VapC family toxin [Corynebacterium sp. CCUG 65737]MCQ4626367.1 type II toxin-antitoxin system VapC family toxin [Corynebacterium sp. CCUG 65737]
MIILDTNVLSEVVKPEPSEHVLQWLRSISDETGTTAVNEAELRAGLRAMPAGQRRRELENVLLGQLEHFHSVGSILNFDHFASTEYADILALRRSAGRPISPQDAMIAAICRSSNAGLATRNVRDFEGLGLNLMNPWE